MTITVPPFFILVIVIIAALIVVIYLRDQKLKNELRQRGVTTTARVTDRQHEVQSSLDNDTNATTFTDYYYISYVYVVNGQTYTRRDSVSESTYNILHEGQPVEIVYLPENPGEARLASSL